MKTIHFDPNNCECMECGKKFPYFSTESPMLNDTVWDHVSSGYPKIRVIFPDGYSEIASGFLCKSCMEKKLGRPLMYQDLKDAELGHSVLFNEQFVEKYFPQFSKRH